MVKLSLNIGLKIKLKLKPILREAVEIAHYIAHVCIPLRIREKCRLRFIVGQSHRLTIGSRKRRDTLQGGA